MARYMNTRTKVGVAKIGGNKFPWERMHNQWNWVLQKQDELRTIPRIWRSGEINRGASDIKKKSSDKLDLKQTSEKEWFSLNKMEKNKIDDFVNNQF